MLATFGGALLALSTVAAAGPAEVCRRAKNLVAGRYAGCRQLAESKRVLTNDQVRYATALDKCRTTYATKWVRAEAQAVAAGGACIVVGDEITIRPAIEGNTSRIATALSGAGLLSCPSALASCQPDLATCLAACTVDGKPLVTEQHCQVLSCPDGEDSETTAGVPRSYHDNGNGTISDLQTGLMWEKLSDDGTIHDKDDTYVWANTFATKIAALNTPPCFATHCDWRLPNANEALSIASYDANDSGVATAFNQGCVAGCDVANCSCTGAGYWTSTSRIIDLTSAWMFYAVDGALFFESKTALWGARAVRGGL